MTKLHDHDAHELPFDAGALLKAKQVQSSGHASESDELTEQDAAEYESAWFDATLDASGFFARAQVKPEEAALLLCGQDPHADKAKERAKTAATEYTTPEDFLRLCMTFADFHETNPMHRSMLDWMLVADNAGRKIHPWARRYVKHKGLEIQPKQETAHNTVAQVKDSARSAPDWLVKKPQRYGGYAGPLHRLLTAEHRDSKPRPTARDVMEMWRINPPPEIAKVLPDGFDYYDSKGDTKTADLEAIRKAIKRMTSAR